MKMRGLFSMMALALAAAWPATFAGAQITLYQESFETDLGGWGLSGFGARPIQITRSNVVASDGSFSMRVDQDGQGFSWNTKREGNSSNTTDPFYQAWNTASTLPENQVFIEFDVIYHHALIPDNATFLNMSVYMNNDNGFRQVDQLALDDAPHIQGNIDQTIHVTIPINTFSGFGDRIPSNANFYQLGWSMNGDWGAGNGTAGDGIGDATVFYDNIRITVIPEPAAAAGALALAGLTAISRRGRR